VKEAESFAPLTSNRLHRVISQKTEFFIASRRQSSKYALILAIKVSQISWQSIYKERNKGKIALGVGFTHPVLAKLAQ
jgi:hypothetical protein